MRVLRLILIIAAALSLASCGSSRKTASDNMSSEDFILAELASMRIPEGTATRTLLDEAFSWKGTPYRAGGHSRSGTDCSGYVMEVYRSALGIDLPRTCAKQAQACEKIKKKDLRPGDLVFFITGKKSRGISHVGIYVGDGRMLHASSSRGIMVSDLDHPYFRERFAQAGRVKGLK